MKRKLIEKNKKRRGFTLIELLAVILILGIIALIAIPTVNSVVEQSRKGAFESSLKNVITAIQTNCSMELLSDDGITKIYTFSKDGIYPNIDIKGNLPESGYAKVNDKCDVETYVTSGNYSAAKSFEDDDFIASYIGDVKIRPLEYNEYDKVYVLTNDSGDFKNFNDQSNTVYYLKRILDPEVWNDSVEFTSLGFNKEGDCVMMSTGFVLKNLSSLSDNDRNKLINDIDALVIRENNEMKAAGADISNDYLSYIVIDDWVAVDLVIKKGSPMGDYILSMITLESMNDDIPNFVKDYVFD